MVTSNPLQQLRDLDRSSPQFHNQLSNLLRGKDYRNSVLNLQSDDLAWLVEHLDTILTTTPIPTNHAFQECLRELTEICGARQILPEMCTLPDSLLNIGLPATIGPVHEGTFNGSKVRVRRVGMDIPGDLESFYRVAVLWKHSAHPNIVPLLGATTHPFQFVSDWMPGGNLTEYTTNHPDADRLGLLFDIAEGLNYLHSCNAIHGDLKGPTILVDATGHARITDFGLATVTRSPDFVWNADQGHAVRWIAPEILNGQGSYSKEADVFSFAMVVIEAFTNTIPFNNDPSDTVISAIIDGKRPPRPTHSTLTDWLWELTQHCWDPEASQRPQVSQVLEVLHCLGRSAWNHLITCPLTTPERTSLVAAIFSDRDEIEAVGHLCGNDAQSFIDTVDEVLDDPTFPFLKKCLKTLRKICGNQSLLPSSLQIPICYDPSDNALYSGGYADVWKGQYQGYSVAVKVLRVYSTSNFEKTKNRFCEEVMTWKTLRHPNVLPLLGATMTNTKFAMTSKWMENGNIKEFIEKHGDTDRFKLLRDIVHGLIYLHGQAMIHGDLKGANVLIDEHGNARLADFGLLIFALDPTNPTASGSRAPAGTTRWMSPELLDPDQFGPKDGRQTKESDSYALGMVIYEVLSGKFPFASYREYVVMRKVIEGERPERPQGLEGERFTDHLWHTLQLCWAQEPKERPTIEEVLGCLGPVPKDRKPALSSMDWRVHDPPRATTSYSLSSSTATLPPTPRKRGQPEIDLEMPSGRDSQRIALIRSSLGADIVHELVNLFFVHCHPGRMMIHKPTFMAALSQNRVASHLILAMCAMSAPFSQSSQVKSHPPRLAGVKFYEDALNILFDPSGRLICEADVQTVQALCLLEMHDIVAQHSWTKGHKYLGVATKILFESADIASPEIPPLSPKPTTQEMTRMTERECARRCYWIIYFLHVLSAACTRNARQLSVENMLMRLPVDETSFTLGIQSQTPEYLDKVDAGTNYVSEFGNVIRITILFSQMEDAVAIVDDENRFVSATQEARMALEAWETSLPEHLRYTEANLDIMNSTYETPVNTGAWCFFYMHALHSCCEISALSEMERRFSSGKFIVPKQASEARDPFLRKLESIWSRTKNSDFLVIPSLWVVSRYFRDNRAVIRADTEFEIAWDWRVCEISETWRKHNKARRLEGKSPTNPNSGDSITSTFTARHLQDISAQISVLSEEFSKDHSQARAILSDLVAPGREPHLSDPSSTTVFVDGLPPLVSEDTLRILFAPFGDTHYVKVPAGGNCGFVQFVRKPDAERAIEKMQGFPIEGCRIRLSWGSSQSTQATVAQTVAMQDHHQPPSMQTPSPPPIPQQQTQPNVTGERATDIPKKLGVANLPVPSNPAPDTSILGRLNSLPGPVRRWRERSFFR